VICVGTALKVGLVPTSTQAQTQDEVAAGISPRVADLPDRIKKGIAG
jgi:hypothetical protein